MWVCKSNFVSKAIKFYGVHLLSNLTDALLAPMVISGKHTDHYFITATIWSALGGIVGYYLGYYLYDVIEPHIHNLGKYEQYLIAKNYFQT